MPPEVIQRLGDSIDVSLNKLGLLILNLPPDGRAKVLDVANRDNINRTLEMHRIVCGLVDSKAENEEVLGCFRRLRITCDQLPSSYFAPPMPDISEQPDQVLRVTPRAERQGTSSTEPNTDQAPPLSGG